MASPSSINGHTARFSPSSTTNGLNSTNPSSSLLGQSPSNQSSDKSANKFIAAFRRMHGLAIDLHPDEIYNHNLEIYINSILTFAATRAIPTHFDDDLNPKRQDNNRCLTTDTLLVYVGLHLKTIRQNNPSHPSFINLQPKETAIWWTRLRGKFKQEHDRFMKSCPNGMYGTILKYNVYFSPHSQYTYSLLLFL